VSSERIASEPLVLYELDDFGVALITWNRPHRRNAWTPEMEGEYFSLLRTAAHDPMVRVIVITGADGHFCPGMDAELLESSSNGSRENAPESREPQTVPMTIPKPIVAAIHGACAGTGFIQACVADVRFVTSDAKITAAFARRGIMAEHGLSVLLPMLIGTAHAMDILISGRVVSGEEASRMGLARLSAPGEALADAMAYAREVAVNCSPQAVAITKSQVYGHLAEPLEKARLEALRLWRSLRDHSDFREGVSSFVARRPPQFEPLDEAALENIEEIWNGTE
jgi:enoyl-CoA hydratase/carnithine racemase